MPEDESSLEKMRSRLYSARHENDAMEYEDLAERAPAVARGWKHPDAPMPRTHKSLPVSVKFLIGAVAFFVIAAAVTALFLFIGGRSVSTNNIDIDIDGPITAAGGDTISLQIAIENKNPVAITDTALSVAFPDGTRDAEDVTKAYPRYDESPGDIESGKAIVRTVRATLFGAENTKVSIPVTLEYRTVNSNAVFVKQETFELTLTSSPVSVTATSVSEISSGQPLTVSLSVRSNATETLDNMALKPQYPFGFSVTSTSIDSENGLIPLGSMKPGEEKKITVQGILTGENNEERVFRWNAGTVAGTNGTLGVVFASADSRVTITRPFFDVTLSLNNETSGTPVVAAGQTVQGTLRWRNTLSVPVTDGKITVKLTGTAFDADSIETSGFFRSSDNTITFDRESVPGLRELAPGDTGVGTFSFEIKSGNALASLRNPSATVTVSSEGRRTGETQVPETLTASLSRSVKIATGLGLSSRAVRTVGPFTNTGPWPLKADQASTFTVMMTASNDVNSIGGATVTATLPSYVSFTGQTSPSDGSISYNSSTRTVTWKAGDMGPSATKQGSFQVSITPSSSQKGTSPTLVSSQTLTGTDRFTQTSVTSTAPALTTEIKSDPAYKASDSEVE